MVSTISLAKWEDYPRALSSYDPVRSNAKAYDKRLRDDSPRLFTDRDNISIDVLDVFNDEPITDERKFTTFTDREQFEERLTTVGPGLASRVFVLKPKRLNVVSRCQLHISEEVTRKLLTANQVMPSFLDYVHAFGMKMDDKDSLFGGCKYRTQFSKKMPQPGCRRTLDSFEICYNFKYVVPNGRGDVESEPQAWSMRQTAVYQKYQFRQQSSTWILVQPEKSVQNRLLEAYQAQSVECIDSEPQGPLDMHLLFLSEATENWRSYHNMLETYLLETTMNAVNTDAGSRLRDTIKQRVEQRRVVLGDKDVNPCELLDVKFEEVQALQKFEEKVQRFRTALMVNEEVITSLRKLNNTLHKFSSDKDENEVAWHSLDAVLEQQMSETLLHKHNVSVLLHEIKGRAELLHNVLQFQNAIDVANSAQQKTIFQDIKRQNSTMITEATKKSARDAVSMKIMTLMALLFLPASFGMSYLVLYMIALRC